MIVWDDRVPRAGWEQMALDRALLDEAATRGTTLLRLYRWTRDTISFGANEATRRHWAVDAIAAAGVATVRRPSGGRAVWHDARDLTYALTAPVTGIPAARATYRDVHGQLASMLEALGLETALAPAPARGPDLGAGSCFEGAAGGEVLVAGRKAIGSAQLVLREALLQHGEIARAERHGALARFARNGTGFRAGPPGVELPPADRLAAAIVARWTALGALPATAEQTGAWLRSAAAWHDHFRDPSWTWRR